MNFLSDEEEHIDQGSLVVTKNRLIQERRSFGHRVYKEIPLKHITSIHFEYDSNAFSLILGLFFIIVGILLLFLIPNVPFAWMLALVFGGLLILFSFLLRREVIEFASPTIKIREKGRDLEDFVELVDELLYKN